MIFEQKVLVNFEKNKALNEIKNVTEIIIKGRIINVPGLAFFRHFLSVDTIDYKMPLFIRMSFMVFAEFSRR